MATLFSVAEARAVDKAQLASATDYPDAAITAKEVEIREWLERACGVNFVPTTHADETHDGDGSNYLLLRWPRITAITKVSVDGEELSSDEINITDYSVGMAVDPIQPIVTRRSGVFASGWSNVVVTYTAGFAAVPALVKQAALAICVEELPATTTPWQADGYDAGGVSYSIGRGDGYNGQWHGLPIVMRAIRMYDHSLPGIA